jgi:ABC-type multidrug transport system fused ATPase/permease subunit
VNFKLLQDNIAYVPQEAWMLNATARDNILFGKPLSQRRYDQVVQACALESDFKILVGGDMTEIGEKVSVVTDIVIKM